MTLITGQVADVGMNNASGVFYARAAEFRGDGQVVVTTAPATFTITDGVVSAEVEPGPTIITLHVGPVRKDWFVNVPETDVGLGDLIATYTTYEPAVVSAAIAARDAAIEAEFEAKQAAIDAEAKRVAAETAADLTGQDRLYVDDVRALLDETYDQSQAGQALPPRLTETALNATYGTKDEVDSLAGSVTAETQTRAAGDADVLSQATAAAVSSARVTSVRVPSADLARRASLTPDGRTTRTLWKGNWTTGDWYQRIVPANATESEGPASPDGGPSTRLALAGAGLHEYAMLDVGPRDYPPASLVHGWLWVEDAGKVSSAVVVIVSGPNESMTTWSRDVTVQNGWNLLRLPAHSGNLGSWGKPRRVNLRINATAATAVAWGKVWMECPPNAQMVFVEDRGYRTFINLGLPDLRSRNIPVTWALDMALNSPTTAGPHITDAEVMQFAAAGDAMSIHAYDGAVTSQMTAKQIRQDALRAQGWLLDRGLPATPFRAAYTQNEAVNAAAADPFFAAQSTSTNKSASMETWPHVNPRDVGRYILHGRTPAQIDAQFATMKATHCVWFPYTHGIDAAGGSNITPTEWTYFLSKVDAAMAEGWLEATTWDRMLVQAGGVLR